MAAATDITVPAPAPAPQTTGLSFTQGFLLGQLSVTLLIFCFIKFFIFGEPPPADERHETRAMERRERTLAHQRTLSATAAGLVPPTSSTLLRHKRSTILRRPPPVTSATILAKTYYNVKGHQPESLDWFNVLIAQTIAQLRADARQDDAVLTSLTNILNGPTRPDWLGEIRVTEIELGDEFPIFSNCRVIPVDEGGLGLGSPSKSDGGGSHEGRLQARMDVDLSDVITLGIETTVMLNWPRPRVAVMPVALAVSVVRFSGTLSLSFIPSAQPANADPNSPNTTHTPTTLAFTFLDDYRLDLSVRSLLGSRSRLQDVPKIAQLIESRLHAWFDERCVEPRFQQIVVPSVWPRKKNTRGGSDEDSAADDEDSEQQAEEPAVDAMAESIETVLDGGSGSKSGARTNGSASQAPAAASSSSTAARPRPQRQFAPGPANELEARMAVEGQKLRDAEQRAERAERARQGRELTDEGVRLRAGHSHTASREASARGDWGNRMPGGISGVGTPTAE
ncbi:mitochondrial outer membrane protein mmm1 [Diplodia corticola]|uniref:Maintenance of mitochondrial morphology protein 1 n=1 Tax=Diplodia corticola TaxID=236234 RepID=A0A1J9QUE1_9PEZI|nr:mitochondrial outer membrane protein mmm1 [Diplodia corticola]OJD31602.1 mitochondrial outer membrane protein mmm1 [Diplodia corticola]